MPRAAQGARCVRARALGRHAGSPQLPLGERVTEIALCLNAGSSSLKFALFRATKTGEEKLAVGNVERLGTPAARVTLHVGESVVERAAAGAGIEQALRLA